MATKADLRDRVLKKIGALGVGETASAEDASLVESVIDNLHEWLLRKEIAYWGASVTAVPSEAQEQFIVLVAAQVHSDFDLPAGDISLDASSALSSLRDLASGALSGEPIEANYF